MSNSSDRSYIDNRYIMDDVELETNYMVVGERNGFTEKEGNTVKRQPKKTDQMQGLKGSKATDKGEQMVAVSSKVAPG